MKRNRVGITPEEEAYLELLHVVIDHYEDKTYQWPRPDPKTILATVMEERGLKQKDLIPYLGAQSRVSEFLSGKIDLTAKQIALLSKALRIPAQLLLPRVEEAAEADLNAA
ncbi:MAG: transcriptional regulator [Bacteroidia bacterium]|nr:transcriptional regulator [Bacteroidia bacterium]